VRRFLTTSILCKTVSYTEAHAIHTSFHVCLAALNPVSVLHVQIRDTLRTSEEDVIFQTSYNFDYSN